MEFYSGLTSGPIHTSIQIPTDGDDVDAVTVNTAFQPIADNCAYISISMLDLNLGGTYLFNTSVGIGNPFTIANYLTVAPTTGNAPAVQGTGNTGTSALGGKFTGGDTGGSGVSGVAGGGNGVGTLGTGAGSGSGVQGIGGATGDGVKGIGGGSGAGVEGTGGATNAPGVKGTGGGNGSGGDFTGAGAGFGVKATAGSSGVAVAAVGDIQRSGAQRLRKVAASSLTVDATAQDILTVPTSGTNVTYTLSTPAFPVEMTILFDVGTGAGSITFVDATPRSPAWSVVCPVSGTAGQNATVFSDGTHWYTRCVISTGDGSGQSRSEFGGVGAGLTSIH